MIHYYEKLLLSRLLIQKRHWKSNNKGGRQAAFVIAFPMVDHYV